MNCHTAAIVIALMIGSIAIGDDTKALRLTFRSIEPFGELRGKKIAYLYAETQKGIVLGFRIYEDTPLSIDGKMANSKDIKNGWTIDVVKGMGMTQVKEVRAYSKTKPPPLPKVEDD